MVAWWAVALCVVVVAVAGKRLLRWRPPAPKTRSVVSRVGRSMGLLERWYSASHEAGCVLNFGFTLCFQAPPAANATRRTLAATLREVSRLLVDTHPPLSCTIVDDFGEVPDGGGASNLVRQLRSAVDTDSCVVVESRGMDRDWRDVALEHYGVPFPSGSPMFRLVLLAPDNAVNDFVVLLLLHHAVCDGMAGTYIAKQVALWVTDDVARAGAVAAARAFGTDVEAPLPPRLDDVMDLRPDLGRIVSEVVKDRVAALARLSKQPWAGRVHVPPGQRTGCTLHTELSPECTRGLVAACRSRGVTVHSALTAAVAVATGSLATQRGDPTAQLGIGAAFSLRARAHVPESRLGVFMAGVETWFANPCAHGRPAQLWQLAASAQAQMRSEAVVRLGVQAWGLLAFLSGSWLQFYQRRCNRAPGGRTETAEISNLGVVDWGAENDAVFHGSRASGIRLTGMWFGQTKPMEGGLFVVSAMTCGASDARVLRITTAYVTPLVTHEEAKHVVNCMEEELRKAASDASK